MKNKGFTIVELIITIAIIAVVTVSVGVSMNGIFSNNEEKEYDSFVNIIENAACTYAEIKGYTTNTSVTINELINYGLIREDLSNPKTKEPIVNEKGKSVSITFENFIKKCTFNVN